MESKVCGLTGYLRPGGIPEREAHAIAAAMAESLAHRGPDDAGAWVDGDAGIALAHRRLSILDMSITGHQPMTSASQRYVIVLNGEIYNHLALRTAIGCPLWRGDSDTETLLAGLEAWGVRATLCKTVGMFAMALWDRAERALYLARDRMGEKPLYYGWHNGVFLFGSQLKALKAHPMFGAEVDRDALTLYMRHNCIPAPYSIYKGIRKLLPGVLLKVSKAGEETSMAYWTLNEAVEAGGSSPFEGSDADAIAALEAQLDESIRLQRVADVPLGAFLSGGVDSSTVVALMQAQSNQPVRTFTIGFHETNYNEAEDAKAVARHLGTDHTELYVTPEETRAVIPSLPVLYDEPFADSSQIPTFLVSKLARQRVTVSLSGDGGDELFGGYNRYFWGNQVWRTVGWLPMSFRKGLARTIAMAPASRWDSWYRGLGFMLPDRLRVVQLGEKLHKLSERMVTVRDIDDFYFSLVSDWKQPEEVVLKGAEPSTLLTDRAAWPSKLAPEHRMMYLDIMSYLPDDILTKVDRAAMGVSLETRAPLLDHRVVELAWRLPLSMKIRDGQGKWILRQVLYRHVPRELIERPKMGFGIPIGDWLRGPLREWAEALLDESRLEREGFFHPTPIRQKWDEHLSGQRDWQQCLWSTLMFQAWLEQQAAAART